MSQINYSILFYSGREGNQEVYTMNSDGTDQTRLTTNPDWDGWASIFAK
jgi:Tol biopolymer transport system component